ncbi:Uncharacterized protein TPAR_00364 [Tolypocladium paradoxum]|uniref:Uncharacterized protein n=1 Tax=Tolypocladium paradoxum TaxID=94208 RepID=A0A2S4LAI1_9HYPO|nr:Uncharacterized protein TPAR_00364 [Tolypocladium paradoxum]
MWLGDEQMDWTHSHLDIGLLTKVYIPRSPGHAKWCSQYATQSFANAAVAMPYLVQKKLAWAHRLRRRGGDGIRQAKVVETNVVRLAAQEIARSYHKHMLEKLQTYWTGLCKDEPEASLKRVYAQGPQELVFALDEVGFREGKMITAQTIQAIYHRAMSLYKGTNVPPSVQPFVERFESEPAGLPFWMRQRPRGGLEAQSWLWTDKVFNVLFAPTKKTWDGNAFYRLYLSTRSLFNANRDPDLAPFEEIFRPCIGRYIAVMFNTDSTKEVGTFRNDRVVHKDVPAFFKIQFWAPHLHTVSATFWDDPRGQRVTVYEGPEEDINTLNYGLSCLFPPLVSGASPSLPANCPNTAANRDEMRRLLRRRSVLATALIRSTAQFKLIPGTAEETVRPRGLSWKRERAIALLMVPREGQRMKPFTPAIILPTERNLREMHRHCQDLMAFRPYFAEAPWEPQPREFDGLRDNVRRLEDILEESTYYFDLRMSELYAASAAETNGGSDLLLEFLAQNKPPQERLGPGEEAAGRDTEEDSE